jgi:hypothetical protein
MRHEAIPQEKKTVCFHYQEKYVNVVQENVEYLLHGT